MFPVPLTIAGSGDLLCIAVALTTAKLTRRFLALNFFAVRIVIILALIRAVAASGCLPIGD